MEINSKKQIEKRLKNYLELYTSKYPLNTVEEISRFSLLGGKRLRPSLMITGYQAFGGKNKIEITKASCSLELIHSYLLIHDDILDQDELRRGEKTSWKYFKDKTKCEIQGKSLAILSGDIAANIAYDILLTSNFDPLLKIKALKKLNQTTIEVLYGQTLDIELQKKKNFTEEDIFEVQKYKTATYTLDGPLQLGAILAGASKKQIKSISGYAIPVGLAFQIQDDILGVFGNEEKVGKPIGSDLKEGKKTLLVLKALELGSRQQIATLKKYLGNQNLTAKQIGLIRKIIKDTGSLDYSYKTAKDLVKKGQNALKKTNIQNNKDYLLDLAEYIVSRNK